MRQWVLATAVTFLGFSSLAVGQHLACFDLRSSIQNYSVDDLLSISSSCKVPAVSDLYYNRANHQRLLQKYRQFERSLIHTGNRDYRSYIDAYRIYIGLAEAFTQQKLSPDETAVLERLNRIYEESGEIAEMRFKGYDLIADRLERKFRL
ncbi:MAG: hypothetical protein KZQ77_05680 [Candidatus Thiodiazotropha sp. (ex Notomyrtea botanica)]|nr:hypothetical protein [Candidatus Thiodiazotropha sp. (ex Notomyrtea botanica)]